jgi:hypothetical protein
MDKDVGRIDWIDLAEDRYRWRTHCGRGNEPPCSIKCGNFLTSQANVSFLTRTLLHGVSWLGIEAYIMYIDCTVFWNVMPCACFSITSKMDITT